jgi:hypothetical protein
MKITKDFVWYTKAEGFDDQLIWTAKKKKKKKSPTDKEALKLKDYSRQKPGSTQNTGDF